MKLTDFLLSLVAGLLLTHIIVLGHVAGKLLPLAKQLSEFLASH